MKYIILYCQVLSLCVSNEGDISLLYILYTAINIHCTCSYINDLAVLYTAINIHCTCSYINDFAVLYTAINVHCTCSYINDLAVLWVIWVMQLIILKVLCK